MPPVVSTAPDAPELRLLTARFRALAGSSALLEEAIADAPLGGIQAMGCVERRCSGGLTLVVRSVWPARVAPALTLNRFQRWRATSAPRPARGLEQKHSSARPKRSRPRVRSRASRSLYAPRRRGRALTFRAPSSRSDRRRGGLSSRPPRAPSAPRDRATTSVSAATLDRSPPARARESNGRERT